LCCFDTIFNSELPSETRQIWFAEDLVAFTDGFGDNQKPTHCAMMTGKIRRFSECRFDVIEAAVVD
jgi:hypothetical protein